MFTSKEIKLLNEFYLSLSKNGKLSPLNEISKYSIDKEQFIRVLNISLEDYVISANNLMRLQLVLNKCVDE